MNELKDITESNMVLKESQHGVTHRIITKGQPVFCEGQTPMSKKTKGCEEGNSNLDEFGHLSSISKPVGEAVAYGGKKQRGVEAMRRFSKIKQHHRA